MYRIISKTTNPQSKIQLIQLFLKWLKLKNNQSIFNDIVEKNQIVYLLKYFNFLTKLLIKYEILQSNWILEKSRAGKSKTQ